MEAVEVPVTMKFWVH